MFPKQERSTRKKLRTNSELQAHPTRFLKSHVRYIVAFKAEQIFKFYYCGSMPIILPNAIKLENIKIVVNSKFDIAISLLNLSCDCGEKFILRTVEDRLEIAGTRNSKNGTDGY